MYYGPRLQSSLSRRAWASAEVGAVVDMTSEDLANSSPSTSGYSTPWSASLQRSQARRRLDHLDDRGGADDDDDDEDDEGTSTPTPRHQPMAATTTHQRPSAGDAADSWSSGADWRSRPPRRRRPARSSDHERGRSPSHARPPWAEERRSLDACDPHLLAVMAAAAQPWIAAAAASSPPPTPCCCSPPPPPHQAPYGHGCSAAAAHAWASQQRRRGCCCSGGVAAASMNWAPQLCGRCFAEPHPAPHGSPCQSWIGGGRCKVRVATRLDVSPWCPSG